MHVTLKFHWSYLWQCYKKDCFFTNFDQTDKKKGYNTSPFHCGWFVQVSCSCHNLQLFVEKIPWPHYTFMHWYVAQQWFLLHELLFKSYLIVILQKPQRGQNGLDAKFEFIPFYASISYLLNFLQLNQSD